MEWEDFVAACDDTLADIDDGPYDTEKEAKEAGKAHGQEWCIINEVDWSRDDG